VPGSQNAVKHFGACRRHASPQSLLVSLDVDYWMPSCEFFEYGLQTTATNPSSPNDHAAMSVICQQIIIDTPFGF
jgi:hypothetical protein